MAVCPIMSYAANQVPCVEKNCALWNAQDGQCAYLSNNSRIADGLDLLIRAINEIKAKL